MAISFPTSLDNFTNPSSGNTLDSPSHSLQHSDINDAVEALEAKLGIGASPAGSATSGQVLTASTGGTTTWSTPTVGGLVQIIPSSVAVGSGSGSVNANGAVTFTGANSVSLNNVFSSTYTNYRIVLTGTGSDNQNFRLRVSGTDNSSSNYQYQRLQVQGTSVAAARTTAGTSFEINGMSDGQAINVIELSNPGAALTTGFNFIGGYNLNATIFLYHYYGYHNVTTAYDGFTFYPGSGTMTGSVSVYGYRN